MSEISGNPGKIARDTVNTTDPGGDMADQAERLTMIMEAEAVRNAVRGERGQYAGEGSLDGYLYPLEDTEELVAMEDADDASNDPMHAGGLTPSPWISSENSAMHIVSDKDEVGDLIDELDDQFND